jgi:alkanesulfonate monooxygenase SsuD/methylene tetrahydromethanopterin reductase-like flavin-dependent oxidoreductase (luciferase family)
MTTGHADHVGRNRTHWDRLRTEYAEWAPRAWAGDEATWGIRLFRATEFQAALQAPLADARKRLSFFGDVDAIATIGTPDRCIDTLKRKAAQGISYFVCLFTDGGQPETVRLFGEKVLPAFR